MPTRRGRMLLAGAAACWIALTWLRIEELITVAAAATMLSTAAIALSLLRRPRLRVRRSVSPARAFAGGRVRLRVEVENRGRRTAAVLLEDGAPPALGGPLRLDAGGLAPGERRMLEAVRTPAARGRHAIGPLRAVVADPFGLAEARRALAEHVQVVVYPRIEPLGRSAPPRTSGRSGLGAVLGPAAGGDEFYEVREWQAGDDLRKIHWPSVARTGELMLRRDETAIMPRATILLDTRAAGHRGAGASSSFEWAISGAASAVWRLAEEGFVVRLATADVPPDRARLGRDAAERLLETLATAAPSRRARLDLRHLHGAGPGGALLAILPPTGVEDASALARAARAFGWLGAVLVDAASFVPIPPADRAEADRRLAETHRALTRAGFRVAVAGARDRFRQAWTEMFVPRASRPSSPSPRS